jgi:hypothetical protein
VIKSPGFNRGSSQASSRDGEVSSTWRMRMPFDAKDQEGVARQSDQQRRDDEHYERRSPDKQDPISGPLIRSCVIMPMLPRRS